MPPAKKRARKEVEESSSEEEGGGDSSKISKSQLSVLRENASALTGSARKEAIQCMTAWLKNNSKGGKPNQQENAEAANVYKGIEDEQERNAFIANFYKARNATGDNKNRMNWAKSFACELNMSESSNRKFNQGMFNRISHTMVSLLCCLSRVICYQPPVQEGEYCICSNRDGFPLR